MADTYHVPFLARVGTDEDDDPLAGVSDYLGRPVYRSTSGGWRSAIFVVEIREFREIKEISKKYFKNLGQIYSLTFKLFPKIKKGIAGIEPKTSQSTTYVLNQQDRVVEVASVFAFYGVAANLITYLTGPLAHSNAAAAVAVNAWSGTATLTPLLGAIVADSWLGRYRSIILACTLYVLGYGMITLASTLPVEHTSPLNDSTPCPSWSQVAFFYASLYLIALAQGPDGSCALAFGADQFDPNHPREYAARSSFFNWWYFCLAIGTAIAVGGVSYIQENLGWGIGFGMLCTIMLCAFVVFFIGTPTYRLYALAPGSDNPFTLLARSLFTLVGNKDPNTISLLDKNIKYQLGDEDGVAKQDDARRVLRILSIWSACLSYGVVLAQVMTLFNKQGRTLDRHIIDGLELPPAALQMFGPATVLLFMPFYECVLVPALRGVTGNPSGLTLLQRLGTGLALSLGAVSMAALVEARRLEIAHEHGLVYVAGATVPMSWVWLVPQYVLIGMACVFAEVGMQEFFYDQMPNELRSLGLALYFSVMGIGSFISGTLIALIDRITKSGDGRAGPAKFGALCETLKLGPIS